MALERLPAHIRGDIGQIRATITEAGDDWTPPVGVQVRCTAKRRYSDSDEDAVFAKSLGDGITLEDNVVIVTLYPEDTEDLPTGTTTTLYCDIQITDDAGPLTPRRFLLPVEPDVTRTP